MHLAHSAPAFRVKGGELCRLAGGRHTGQRYSELRHRLDKALKLLPGLFIETADDGSDGRSDGLQWVHHLGQADGPASLSNGKPEVIRVYGDAVLVHLVAEASEVALCSKRRHPAEG